MNGFLFFSNKEKRIVLLLIIIIVSISTGRMMLKNYLRKANYISIIQEIKQADSLNNLGAIPLPVNFSSNNLEQNNNKYKKQTKVIPNVEINSIDSAGLLPLPGIGPFFANKIIKYRERLGGFCLKKQLLEIKNFPPETYEIVCNYITIDTSLIHKIKINTADFKDILRHPYSNYEITKIIVNERKKMYYTSAQDFVNRTGLADSTFLKYLDFEY